MNRSRSIAKIGSGWGVDRFSPEQREQTDLGSGRKMSGWKEHRYRHRVHRPCNNGDVLYCTDHSPCISQKRDNSDKWLKGFGTSSQEGQMRKIK